jgi:uncharacterized protein YutE (UPF0331/DUF86 family)
VSPGQADAELVRRHLLALDRALELLRQSQDVSLERLREDPEKRWAVERGLQVCAQNAIDVATHLASAQGRDSADYAESIDHLAELSVLPRDFADRFRAIAGFRNVLVHGYLEVDVTIVHRVLTRQLDDFVAFARHVAVYLERLG